SRINVAGCGFSRTDIVAPCLVALFTNVATNSRSNCTLPFCRRTFRPASVQHAQTFQPRFRASSQTETAKSSMSSRVAGSGGHERTKTISLAIADLCLGGFGCLVVLFTEVSGIVSLRSFGFRHQSKSRWHNKS